MPIYAYGILAAGWVVWFLPFPLQGWSRATQASSDHRARWGLMLQAVAYLLVWPLQFWTKLPGEWRVVSSVILFALAALLSWTATRALGRHLRFEAALSSDHQLVRLGPYRLLRHPIYASMGCLLLATGAMVSTRWHLLLAVVVFVVGTEIRVHVEDGLLAARFGAELREYQKTVKAYVPFVR